MESLHHRGPRGQTLRELGGTCFSDVADRDYIVIRTYKVRRVWVDDSQVPVTMIVNSSQMCVSDFDLTLIMGRVTDTNNIGLYHPTQRTCNQLNHQF
jgi:hypothetical protein